MKMTMTALAIAIFLLACAHCPPMNAVAASTTAAGLLPESGRVEGWKTDGDMLSYSADNLWEYINGSAESFLMYDFLGVAARHYLDESGNEIKVEIYEHGSSLMAFGIYSQMRSPDAEYLEFGNESFGDEYTIHFWKGRYYVKIYAYEEGPGITNAMKTFASAVDGDIDEPGSIPEDVSLFPEEGMKAKSVTYVTGGILGSGKLPPAFVASYAASEGTGKIHLFVLEDGEKAAGLFSSYSGEIGAKAEELESAGKKYIRAAGEAPYRGRVVVMAYGKRVGILSGFGDHGGQAESLAAKMVERMAVADGGK